MQIVSSSIVALALLTVAQTSAAQQAPLSPQIIAQAVDRCMATYAVRLTRTAASDESIYAAAEQGCRPLNDQLKAAARTAVPPAQADAFIQQLDASAKPNFLAMLARIRSDRAARDGVAADAPR